tara:strand:+ start:2495 stop:3451 length:957 start_codon:yes stop_codon:yes gene_type:complete
MKYQFEECLDSKYWDKFVSKSPQNNIFCYSKFLDASHNNFKTYFVKKNGNIMLGCILIIAKDSKNCITPFMYQSLLFDEYIANLPNHRSSKIIIDSIEFLLSNLENYYNNLAFSLHYTINDIRAFQWFNYHSTNKPKFIVKPRYTGILKFDDDDNFDSLLKKSRKVRVQEYHKSVKKGFKVSISNDINILDDLHDEAFSRQGLKRTNGEKLLVSKISKIAIEEGFGRLMVCSTNLGEPVSAAMFLLDDNRGYYLVGATNSEYRNYGVGSFVMFEQIRKCFDDGLKEIDFIGINSPQRGDFKTSFNAKSELYFELHYSV